MFPSKPLKSNPETQLFRGMIDQLEDGEGIGEDIHGFHERFGILPNSPGLESPAT